MKCMRGNHVKCILPVLLLFVPLIITGCLEDEKSQEESIIVTTHLSISEPPLLNRTALLTYNITAVEDLSDEEVSADIILPEGLLLVDGNITWNGSLSQRKSKIIEVKIKPIKVGVWGIEAIVGLRRGLFRQKDILEKDTFVIRASGYYNILGSTLANSETYGYKGIYKDKMNSPDIVLTVRMGNALSRTYSTNITDLDILRTINRLETTIDFNHSDYGANDGVIYIEGFFSLLREINISWQLKVMSSGMIFTTPIGEGRGIYANQNQIDSIIRQISSDYKNDTIFDTNDDAILDTSIIRMKLHSKADKDEIISKLNKEIQEIEKDFSRRGDVIRIEVEITEDREQNNPEIPLMETTIITVILIFLSFIILRRKKGKNVL